MPNLSSIPHCSLKVIFAVHFTFISWAFQGRWFPMSLIFYNLIFFVCLLWAIHSSESDEPIQFALFVNVLSIIFDIITLSVYFPESYGGWEKASAAMVAINLIVRVGSSYVLLLNGRARGGTLATILAQSPTMGFGRQEYEDMSQPVPSNADFA